MTVIMDDTGWRRGPDEQGAPKPQGEFHSYLQPLKPIYEANRQQAGSTGFGLPHELVDMRRIFSKGNEVERVQLQPLYTELRSLPSSPS